MPYGISDKHIKGIVDIMAANPKVDEMILFGSRAKGNFSKGSDVDMAIKGSNLKLGDISRALVQMDDLYLPYKIDLIIYERIQDPDLVRHIDKRGKILYKRNKA